MTLQNKVVLVTGASRSIGKALAVGFAAEGAIVVASARTQSPGTGAAEGSLDETLQEILQAGGRAVAIPCDVSQEEQVKALVARTLAEVGPVDVLVNNAGLYHWGSALGLSADEFDRVVAVNLKGPFLTCKHVLPGMIERRQGNVINVSSRNAIWEEPNSPVYGPSKAGLERFTLNLAAEMRPYNIAVNALGPGLVLSEMTRGWEPTRDPLGRVPDPPEVVVPATLWLARQDASTFTGRVVHRDEFGDKWP